MEDKGDGKIKRCPLCGCTEHRLIGCHRHKGHRQGPDGRCITEQV